VDQTKCQRCCGCGQIADSESGEPWSDWINLPINASFAVLAGIVRPITCPECGGTGLAHARPGKEPAGLYGKYNIEKADGTPVDPAADYFVLRLDSDPAARAAALAYADHVADDNPQLANDLRLRVAAHALTEPTP
jgi:hypothetical protein